MPISCVLCKFLVILTALSMDMREIVILSSPSSTEDRECVDGVVLGWI